MGVIETGALISKIRKRKNMTQKDIASYLNVSDKAVSKWERGDSYPEITTLLQLAGLLEVTVDELLTGKEKSNTDSKSEEISDNERTLAYSCLLENASNKFYKKTIITYLIIVVSILLAAGFVNYNYKIVQIVTSILGLIAIILYNFSKNEYNISIKRFQKYIEKDDKLAECEYQIKYSSIFNSIAIGILFIIIISSTNNVVINNKYFINTTYSNLAVPFVLILSVINLYIYFIVYHKCLEQLLGRENKKFNLFSNINIVIMLAVFLGVCCYTLSNVDFIIALDLLGRNIYRDMTKLICLTIISVVLIFMLNIILVVLIKEKTKRLRYWIVIISSAFQLVIMELSFYSNVKLIKFKTVDITDSRKATIVISNMILSFLCAVTIWNLTNLFTIRNRKEKTLD